MREMLDSFGARSDLTVGDERYGVWRLDAVVDDPRRLPRARDKHATERLFL